MDQTSEYGLEKNWMRSGINYSMRLLMIVILTRLAKAAPWVNLSLDF